MYVKVIPLNHLTYDPSVCWCVYLHPDLCLYLLYILLCSGGFRAPTFGQRVESAVNNNSVQGVRSDKNRATESPLSPLLSACLHLLSLLPVIYVL